MQRRSFLTGAAATALLPALPARAADVWGGDRGYPTGWSPNAGGWERDTVYRVGNYSGGYEGMFPLHRVAAAGGAPAPLGLALRDDLTYGAGRRLADYVQTWPVTGLLIARDGIIRSEYYGFARQPQMRFTSWSMAKSVTSLLLGICIDRGLVASLDDTADRYVDSLAGTVHGQTSLRDLANMSSGAQILHAKDNATLYPQAFLSKNADLETAVRGWNWRAEKAGSRFNYNELCPLTIGMVIRRVTGKSLAQFCSEQIWQPLHAEAEATWMTDSKGKEFNCIGFAARLRDWARLAQMIAQNGEIGGRQIVSGAWLTECSSWSERDRQVRHGSADRGIGYKCFFWHPRSDGSWMMMLGHHGQVVLIDRRSRTVLVHTAVEHDGAWRRELFELFDAATKQG